MQVSGGSWTAQVDERDEDAVHRYEPLLVAELEGRTLPCSILGCASSARAMAKVSVPICLEHLAMPVGVERAKPGRIGIVGAIVSAVGV